MSKMRIKGTEQHRAVGLSFLGAGVALTSAGIGSAGLPMLVMGILFMTGVFARARCAAQRAEA